MLTVISFLVKALTLLASVLLSHLTKGQGIDYRKIAGLFMTEQTHNDTVMTANLTTLSKKNAEKEVTGVTL